MSEPLRPLSTGEILDRTFSLYRRNFVLLIGVAILGPLALLVAQLSMALVGFGGQNARAIVANPLSVGGTVLVGIIFYLIGHAISVAATTRAVAAVYLGRTITIAQTFAAIKGRVPRVIGVMLLAMLVGGAGAGLLVGLGSAVMGALVVGGRAAAGRMGAGVGGFIGVIALIASIVAAVAFVLRYALSVQACVVEDLGVRASLARSKVLTQGARKRLMTVMVVCSAVLYVLTLLFATLSLLVPGWGVNPLARQMVSQISGLFAGALGAPLVTAALSLLYYDERVRKEGFDLQLLMESLDQPDPLNTEQASASLG